MLRRSALALLCWALCGWPPDDPCDRLCENAPDEECYMRCLARTQGAQTDSHSDVEP